MNFQNNTTLKDLLDFCPELQTEQKDLQVTLQSFSAIEQPEEKCLVFINDARKFTQLLDAKIICVLAPLKLKPQRPESLANKIWLWSPNPELSAREIKNRFVLATPYQASWQGIHPTAVIAKSATVGKGTTIGPYAVVGEKCQIDDNVFIGSHVVIEAQAQVGSNTTLHPFVYIGHSCQIGKDCEIKPHAVIGSEGFGYAHNAQGEHFRIPHSGRVILHDGVHVGAGTAIDRGTLADSIIGAGTKIDNQCHLAHNTVIGQKGLITAQVVTAGSTTIGNHFICGGKTAITGHIEITDHVNVAGLSGVSNDVLQPGQYGGYPLQPLRDFLKVKASSVHVPELRKQMNRVLRKLFPEDYQS